MRRVQSVSNQHDILEKPSTVLHEQKVDPLRIIREQLLPVEILREDITDIVQCLLAADLFEAGPGPRLWIAFDNERAGCRAEFVRVCREHPSAILAKRQS